MEAAAEILKKFDVVFELTIVSAHRTPMRMLSMLQSAQPWFESIIAGAGGAAQFADVASLTTLPVMVFL